MKIGNKYKDNNDNIITITGIRKNTTIAGTNENMITYSMNNKDGYTMLENSIYAKSLNSIV